MREAAVVFPHQLFYSHPAITKNRPVFLLEEQLLFGDYKWQKTFHFQKLMLHRASMKYYADSLAESGHVVTYIDHVPSKGMENLFSALKAQQITHIVFCDPVDYLITKRVKRLCQQHSITTEVLESPSFLISSETALERLSKSQRQSSFYSAQRKDFNIMLKENGKPVGGKWSFDAQNRYKYDGSVPIPPQPERFTGKHASEAEKHITQTHTHAFGKKQPLLYPHTHEQAKSWLSNFIEHKLHHFGAYQDAILQKEDFLFHALISPALNIGLLTPQQVINAALQRWDDDPTIPLNSIEGFIRQVLGWREFMRASYIKLGNQQRTTNFFKHTRSIPESFYNGTTGILPVDSAIKRVLTHGYCHHIERLMVLGNFMLLCEIDPDDVFMWFLELFIDSYDWVMVPNVYSMSQYADGGLITTKPYVSGSNYVRKMSDYPEGKWCDIWNGLYWRFLYTHYELFESNNRTRPMTWGIQRMKEDTLTTHLAIADSFLNNL